MPMDALAGPPRSLERILSGLGDSMRLIAGNVIGSGGLTSPRETLEFINQCVQGEPKGDNRSPCTMSTPNVQDFVASNAAFAEAFDKGGLPMPPRRKALVLTCMDARLHPEKVLGLNIGDCHVVRNAGGRASPDALRSIAISQRLLGTTEVIVIHHTDCGMLTFTDDVIRQKIRSDLGDSAGSAADQIQFLPFSDVDQSVRDDMQAVKDAVIVAEGIPITGFVYDINTGKLKQVQ